MINHDHDHDHEEEKHVHHMIIRFDSDAKYRGMVCSECPVKVPATKPPTREALEELIAGLIEAMSHAVPDAYATRVNTTDMETPEFKKFLKKRKAGKTTGITADDVLDVREAVKDKDFFKRLK